MRKSFYLITGILFLSLVYKEAVFVMMWIYVTCILNFPQLRLNKLFGSVHDAEDTRILYTKNLIYQCDSCMVSYDLP